MVRTSGLVFVAMVKILNSNCLNFFLIKNMLFSEKY